MNKEQVIEAYNSNLLVLEVLSKELDEVKKALEKTKRNFEQFKPIVENI